MVAIWYLLVLAPLIAIPVLWWNYRRKLAQKEELSGVRWEQLVSAARTGGNDTGDSLIRPAPAPAPRYLRRERLLDPAQTLAFLLLKQGLPDHEILPGFALSELLELPPDAGEAGREQRRRLLAQQRVDFVVCSKSMQPLVTVDLIEHEAPAVLTAAPDFKSQCLHQAGIRHVRLLRSALPSRRDIRAHVLGG